ncbi:ATP-dependent RNA helicase dbp10 [Pichia californica]|uniref:ATP-dependent RNA helicase DBP10 n=1 Tax=Pichia californica TaxID=460514 RepID=A0A9P7BGE7_9ASCO|nr:ATP-dependent RNA helicase dbp10 [[Candida] californica]
MSSDEEEVDIWSSLVPNKDVEESSDEDSDLENGQIQDEIVSSDEEDDDNKKIEQSKPRKKQKNNSGKSIEKLDFPSLEIEDENKINNNEHEEDMYFINQEQQSLQSKNKNKGSFASFGLSKIILSNISKKGYRQPTPIQRKTIPLIMQNRDVVGMARTGSGKTAAFLLPLIEKLKTHSAKIGIRSIILSPSRELAVQTHKQFKEFSKGTDLRSLLLIGGDSLEDQFGAMINNPDIIIATPGRFLHLKVEMRLDLSSIEFIIYDEADRLFEMGFSEQLNELLASLPERRQSMLFSATLPRNLVDFAKAGLINPVLVRLDTEMKISEELEMCFFSSKKNEREANLLSILQDVIKMPFATDEQLKKLNDANNNFNDSDSDSENENNNKNNKNNKKEKYKNKKKIKFPKANELPSKYSTIVFVPTRHHVEYITNILKAANYPVSYIYGSLDQHARRQQLQNFRLGLSSIMVVTDVAARGIDIPILANVINYTLPSSSKIFIHRVGRTARAGNKGWAYSIVSENELPYLLDLEIFLGNKILLSKMFEKKVELLKEKFKEENNGSIKEFKTPKILYNKRIILGSIPRIQIEIMEDLYETILRHNFDIKILKGVCEKAEKLYMRSRTPASQESVRRSKELINVGWDEQNLIFGKNLEEEKNKFLEKLQNRINKETIFEFGKRDDNLIELMNKRRKQIAPIHERMKERRALLEKERMLGLSHTLEDEILKDKEGEEGFGEVGFNINEEELMKNFEDGDKILESNNNNNKSKSKKTFKDPNFYMPYYAPRSVIQDQQFSINGGNSNGGNFISEVNKATFDIDAEDDKSQIQRQGAKVVWEKNKFVRKQDDRKFIISESGQKIPASFRSGKYEEWKGKHNIGNIKVGSKENLNEGKRFENKLNGSRIGGRFKHQSEKAPKMPKKGRDDYHKQMDKVKKAVERGVNVKGYVSKGSGKNEIRDSESIRKQREQKNKRREKNARPSRKRR